MNTPLAVVYSVCTSPKSHDFFLVPLIAVNPFVPESVRLNESMNKEQALELKKSHEMHFNQLYGSVKKGLFLILYTKQVFVLEEDATSW